MMLQLLAAGAITIAVDRFAKRAVESRLAVGESVALARGVALRHVRAPQLRRRIRIASLGWLALALIAIALLLLAQTGIVFHRAAAQLGLGAAVGGAASNLIDLRRGGGQVTDFVAIGWWPPFNLADVAIVAGVALAVLFAA